MISYRIIEPIDILFLRGNKLFGGAGEHGYSQMPPWPSVFSGAMASFILAENGLLASVVKDPEKAEDILEGIAGDDFGCVFTAVSYTHLTLPTKA